MTGGARDPGLGAAEREAILALADDEHLMGQRHTEWIGVAPFLEEDLAFSSIAQDELGHALMLYELLAGAGPGDTDLDTDVDTAVDALAFGREPAEYRSCWLVEAPCTDWAEALVRHWLYDAAEELRWRELATSRHAGVRGVAERALHEEQYHRRHADALLDALGHDRDARERLAVALTELLPLAVAMFEPTDAPVDPTVIGAPLDRLRPAWCDRVDRRFGERDWPAIDVPSSAARTTRSADFAAVYDRMRQVMALDPAARW